METYNKRTSAEKKKGRKGESEFVSTNDVSRNIGHIGGQIGTQLDGQLSTEFRGGRLQW